MALKTILHLVPTMNRAVALAFILPLLCHLLTTVVGASRHDSRPHHPPQPAGDDPVDIEVLIDRFPHHFLKLCSHLNPLERRWKPNFLKNVTDEGLKQFCEIIRNQSLTKSEMKDQLDQWAKDQGGNVYDEFSKFAEKMKQEKDEFDEKIQTLIRNTTSFLSSAKRIMDDMSLTREEAREKLINLTRQTNPSVLAVAEKIFMEAHFPGMGHHGKPCPPCKPHRPGHHGPHHGQHHGPHHGTHHGPLDGPHNEAHHASHHIDHGMHGIEPRFPHANFRPGGPLENDEPFGRDGPLSENVHPFDSDWSPFGNEMSNIMNIEPRDEGERMEFQFGDDTQWGFDAKIQ